ncbi:tetratricopeptide repeat protein [Ketobacter sp. MCCC 1A13808]|uniref:tetratricopeptide repeat protein n=1 Tax=Ketobacter sp. MCCC 1A13808 TaxID=2602738 RepID=UPI000F117423|nr:tetratricopeptide repeat protein [Ketobacter sp. MCCC 1A13808]MVF14261.1 tetratricopeptide repeat protein [Ketobacter sp. MCCC 1A13808]RLP53512.1 MAG: hypothetical protein D6160_15390 [Ketobacter sp.]
MGKTSHTERSLSRLIRIIISGFSMAALLCLAFSSYADEPPALTALVYKKLIESQQALDEKNNGRSLSILQSVAGNRFNTAYDNAMIWHMTGYIEFKQGNLKDSAHAFEKVFDYDIPLSLSISNHKILSQVYMNLGQYQKALPHIQFWVENNDKERADANAVLAQCYYELKHYKQAASHLQQAINNYQAQGKTPKEQWLNLLQSSQAQLQDLQQRIRTIKLLLTWFPKKEYWMALASAYAQQDNMDNYLAILALAERKELLASESQYLSLASVYLAQGAPMNGARVVEEGLSKQRIKATLRNLRFLASAYSLAREYEQALEPLQQAATLDQEGETDLLLGNALYQLARWPEAAKAFETALEKGNLSQTTNAWLLLGQTYLNTKQFDRSLAAFEQAAQDDEKSEQAQQWLKYVRYEQQRAQAGDGSDEKDNST